MSRPERADAAPRGPWICALIPIILLAGCSTAPRAPPRAPAPPYVIERVDRTHSLGEGRVRVRIDNPWGNVNVRGIARRELVVHAVVQRIGEKPERERIELGGDARSAELRIGFERAGRDCARRQAVGERVGRVDLAVFVPHDVALEVVAGCDGAITTDLVRGDLVARTESGGISAAATGRVELASATGRIRAWLALETREASSVNSAGPVIATLPAAARATIAARACGGFRTRELVLRETPARDGCATGVAVLGEGGAELSVVSSGSWVELRTQTGTRE